MVRQDCSHVMKTHFIIVTLLATCLHATAQSNTTAIISAAPHWGVLEAPREWPKKTEGSNSLIQCAVLADGETAKAQAFLLTRSYHVIEGGLKGDAPHTVVPYPGSDSDTWTIFFSKDTLKPISIERKGTETDRYHIQLNPRSKLLTNLSSSQFNLFCNPAGVLRGFATPIRGKLKYTLGWDAEGHLETEQVFDWSERGKVIKK